MIKIDWFYSRPMLNSALSEPDVCLRCVKCETVPSSAALELVVLSPQKESTNPYTRLKIKLVLL